MLALSALSHKGVGDRASTRSAVLRSEGAGEDVVHDGRFGVGVVLHVFPGAGRQLTLRAFVEIAIRFVAAQPIAKGEQAADFFAAVGEGVKIDVGGG